jgi:hypothetical protein
MRSIAHFSGICACARRHVNEFVLRRELADSAIAKLVARIEKERRRLICSAGGGDQYDTDTLALACVRAASSCARHWM